MEQVPLLDEIQGSPIVSVQRPSIAMRVCVPSFFFALCSPSSPKTESAVVSLSSVSVCLQVRNVQQRSVSKLKAWCDMASKGAFSHSAGTAPIITVIIQGNNPENHPPAESCTINSKTQKFKHLMLAMGPRDLNSAPYSPVHCSSHSMTSFQSSELTELPVVENSQLFAQRTVRPLREGRCVPSLQNCKRQWAHQFNKRNEESYPQTCTVIRRSSWHDV